MNSPDTAVDAPGARRSARDVVRADASGNGGPTLATSGDSTAHGQAVLDQTEQAVGPELPVDRFLDRELSWLAFNNRVLDLAKDRVRVPLLERAKFLAIFATNLDEFFMVRVAGLKRRIAAGVAVPTVSGLMPREVHTADPRPHPGAGRRSRPASSTRRCAPSSRARASRSCAGTS